MLPCFRKVHMCYLNDVHSCSMYCTSVHIGSQTGRPQAGRPPPACSLHWSGAVQWQLRNTRATRRREFVPLSGPPRTYLSRKNQYQQPKGALINLLSLVNVIFGCLGKRETLPPPEANGKVERVERGRSYFWLFLVLRSNVCSA